MKQTNQVKKKKKKHLLLKTIKPQIPEDNEQGNQAENYNGIHANDVKENHGERTGQGWEMTRRRHKIINAPSLLYVRKAADKR